MIKWLIVITMMIARVEDNAEVMKSISIVVGKKVNECQEMLQFGDQFVQDFLNFWNGEYDFLERTTGCVVVCVAIQLDLVGREGQVIPSNFQGFLTANGADNSMVKKISTTLNYCRKVVASMDDICLMGLEVIKCLRNTLFDLDWVPNMFNHYLINDF